MMGEIKMAIVHDFVDRYKKEFDYYEMVSKLVAQQLENGLKESGIRAIVTYRAKNPERLLAKLIHREEEKKYSSDDDIYLDIPDLSGVRVALYFPSDREKVASIIKELFFLLSDPIDFPSKNRSHDNSKRFSGYRAQHYRVSLLEKNLSEPQKRYLQARTEIQVASVLMHAWSEVEHDLVYKPLNGELSEEELTILDELNGLVMVGEIALERLKKAGDIRVNKNKIFNNQYELASYLYNKYNDKNDNGKPLQLGNIELLYNLIKECGINSQSEVNKYLSNISLEKEAGTICEQIADNVILGNDERYKVYSNLKSTLNLDDDLEYAIGNYIKQWIQLEMIVKSKTADYNPRSRNLFSLNNIKKIFPNEDCQYISFLRRERNLVVHGIELPPVDDLNRNAEEVKKLCLKYSVT